MKRLNLKECDAAAVVVNLIFTFNKFFLFYKRKMKTPNYFVLFFTEKI